MSKVNGKVAVITGGNSGIGLAIAQRFVEEAAHVFIFGRRETELQRAAETIGQSVTAVRGDVTSAEDLDRLFATVKTEKGSLDIIVTSAGILRQDTLSDPSIEAFDQVFDVNVRGTYRTVQKGVPLLRDGGSIVLVSSCLSNKALPGATAYGATKAAVRSLSRGWAAELKGRGIRVNTLSPGPIDTPLIDLTSASPEEAAEKRAAYPSLVPLNRVGQPAEIAAAALFLASSESSYSTGIDLVADGGMTQL